MRRAGSGQDYHGVGVAAPNERPFARWGLLQLGWGMAGGAATVVVVVVVVVASVILLFSLMVFVVGGGGGHGFGMVSGTQGLHLEYGVQIYRVFLLQELKKGPPHQCPRDRHKASTRETSCG